MRGTFGGYKICSVTVGQKHAQNLDTAACHSELGQGQKASTSTKVMFLSFQA